MYLIPKCCHIMYVNFMILVIHDYWSRNQANCSQRLCVSGGWVSLQLLNCCLHGSPLLGTQWMLRDSRLFDFERFQR
jgi:hypothetical protein